MKALASILAILLVIVVWSCLPLAATPQVGEVPFALQSGDIVFQGIGGEQSIAVSEATDSPYSHCGVVFLQENRLMVLEAVQPVRVTPLEHFAARSKPGTFHAMRLKSPPSQESVNRAWLWGRGQTGRHYDFLFRWDDEKLYCSELVWKLYQQAGIELCPRRHFTDYHLDRPTVKKIVTARYGGIDKLPADEWVVAPSDIAASPLLEDVPRR